MDKQDQKIKLTDEQEKAIKELLEGNNVIVQAVAGSGKTTSSLEFARRHEDKKFLILTYNTKLAKDTNERIKQRGLTNIWCFTLHSIGNKIKNNLYSNLNNPHIKLAHKQNILNILKSNIETNDELKNILFRFQNTDIHINDYFKSIKINNDYSLDLKDLDFLILDEVQDFTPMLFAFVIYYFLCNKNINPFARIFILGDKKQNIYENFTQSSSDIIEYFATFISYLDDFKLNNRKFSNIQYLQNFRSNEKILGFINDVFLNTKQDQTRRFKNAQKEVIDYNNYKKDNSEDNEDNIVLKIYSLNEQTHENIANWRAEDRQLLYKKAWIQDSTSDEFRSITKDMCKKIAIYIKECIDKKHINIEDIAVARFSVNKESLMDVTILEEELVEQSISPYNTSRNASTYDGDTIDTDLNNRLEITTIHKLKGREKKVIILFNFDHTAFKNTLMQDFSNNGDEKPYLDFLSNLQYVALTRAIDYLYITLRLDNFNLPKKEDNKWDVYFGLGAFWNFENINKYTNLDEQTQQSINIFEQNKKDDNNSILKMPNKKDISPKFNALIEISPSIYYKELNDDEMLDRIKKKIKTYKDERDKIISSCKNKVINDKYDKIYNIENDKETTYTKEQTTLMSLFVLSKCYYRHDEYKDNFAELLKEYGRDIIDYYKDRVGLLDCVKSPILKEVFNEIWQNKFNYEEANDEKQLSFWALYEGKHNDLSFITLPYYKNLFENKDIAYEKMLDSYKDIFSKHFNLEYTFNLKIAETDHTKMTVLKLPHTDKEIKIKHKMKNIKYPKTIDIDCRFDAISVINKQAHLFEFKWTNSNKNKQNAHLCQVLLYLSALNEFHQAKLNQNIHLANWLTTRSKKAKSFKDWINLELDSKNDQDCKLWLEEITNNGYDYHSEKDLKQYFIKLLSFELKEYSLKTYSNIAKLLTKYSGQDNAEEIVIDANISIANTWFFTIWNEIRCNENDQFKKELKKYKKKNLALFYNIEDGYLVNYRTNGQSFKIDNYKYKKNDMLKTIKKYTNIKKLDISTLISQLKNLKDKVGGFNWDLDTIQKEIEAKIQKENEENKDNEDNKTNTDNLNDSHSLTNSQTDNFNQSIITKPKSLK